MIPKTEQAALVLPIIASAIVGVAGPIFAWITGSSAILLDGLFNLAYCLTAIFSLQVSRLLSQGSSEDFPFGFVQFEPFVNMIKGLMILGVSALAFYDAIIALTSGGRTVVAGLAVTYGLGAATIGLSTAYILHATRRHFSSPLIEADIENWVINGVISSIVVGAFLLIPVAEGFEQTRFLTPYIDPILVLVVIVCSILVPIRLTWASVRELLTIAAPAGQQSDARAALQSALSELPDHEVDLRMARVGRTPLMLVHVVLPAEFEPGRIGDLDRIRLGAHQALSERFDNLMFELVFTAQRGPANTIAMVAE